MAEETKPLTEGEGTTNYTDAEKGEGCKTHRLNFIGRIDEARKNSTGPLNFLKEFFLLLLDTVGFVIFAGIILAIPVAMIVVGSLNLNDCPTNRFIPIWMLVSGAVMAFQQLIYILKTSIGLGCFKQHEEHVSKFYGCFNLLLLLFTIGWFIAGNVWVFSAYKPNIEDSADSDFCEAGVYYFSFALIIAAYAWLLFTMCCSGCVAALGVKEIARHASNVATGGHGEPTPKE